MSLPAEKAREETGINTVALSGGVYQNKLLLDYSVTMLEERGFHVRDTIYFRQMMGESALDRRWQQ